MKCIKTSFNNKYLIFVKINFSVGELCVDIVSNSTKLLQG